MIRITEVNASNHKEFNCAVNHLRANTIGQGTKDYTYFTSFYDDDGELIAQTPFMGTLEIEYLKDE